jgi:AbrB family looped-hinge helix DNA binding protein
MTSRSYESRITSKGQTTIPIEVRERLKVGAGDTIQYVLVDGHFEIIPRNRPAAGLFGRLQAYALPNTSLDDYREAVLEHFAHSEEDRGDKEDAA